MVLRAIPSGLNKPWTIGDVDCDLSLPDLEDRGVNQTVKPVMLVDPYD